MFSPTLHRPRPCRSSARPAGPAVLGPLPLALALALGSALCPHAVASRQDSIPEWVQTAAAQIFPAYPPDTPAVVLLDQTTYSVAPDGRAVEHVRHVAKILRPQGRDQATIHLGYDKDTKILSFKVWSIGADGHPYAMQDKDFLDYGAGGDGVAFNDERFRVARAPGADPGAVIAYEYEQRSRPFVTEKTWFFQEDIPHRAQTFTLELPPGFTYSTTWSHHAPMQAADLEASRWRWEIDDVPGIDLEHVPLSPSPLSLAARMTVHYAGPGVAASTGSSWKQIGEWYAGISQDRLAATPDIAARAQALTAGKTDFFDKAEAIGEFVQKQVRYFAVEVGIGGYQPHPAADIFHHMYGDCKDKATLVSAMLSSVGIHSALMMVDSSRGVVDPGAPSLVGNHMIAAIEIPAGYQSPRLHSVVTAGSGRRYLIFDPTWDKTPFGQLEHNLQGGYGILMEGPTSEALALPVLDPALDTIRRTASFRLGADGLLHGDVTEKRFGDVAEGRRTIYTQEDAKQQRDFLDHSLEHDFTSFKVSNVKVENAASLNQDFTLTYSLDAERYARSMGSLLMVRPRVLGTLAPQTDLKKRTVPINLDKTFQATDDYTIELPEGFAVDELPQAVKLDVGFAAYQSSAEVKGRILHYTRTYTVREVLLPASRYGELQKLSSTIAADEESHAVLKKQ
ncbi:MAG: DUF3857 and transglutaminase domain-containing protein [Acidobacteriota bacterium]|nr:DUF3857 and transglutaminase domain-containing protein [Acidobacteriota bacterium]